MSEQDDDRLKDELDDEERAADAAFEAHIEQVLDDNTAFVHEWLERKYRAEYEPGQTELCLEAVSICQEEKAPLPDWLVDALKEEIKLALRRPVAWDKIEAAARQANRERKEEAERRKAWCQDQAKALMDRNPNINSESRLAELIAKRAADTEHDGLMPRTIRRHIQGILATRSKHGQK